eukprot:255806-Amphidinium_carterae.1
MEISHHPIHHHVSKQGVEQRPPRWAGKRIGRTSACTHSCLYVHRRLRNTIHPCQCRLTSGTALGLYGSCPPAKVAAFT